jgi:hypothetical protein
MSIACDPHTFSYFTQANHWGDYPHLTCCSWLSLHRPHDLASKERFPSHARASARNVEFKQALLPITHWQFSRPTRSQANSCSENAFAEKRCDFAPSVTRDCILLDTWSEKSANYINLTFFFFWFQMWACGRQARRAHHFDHLPITSLLDPALSGRSKQSP